MVLSSYNDWKVQHIVLQQELVVESHFDAIQISSTLSCSSIALVGRITMRRLRLSRYHELSYCQYIQHTLFDSELIIPKLSSK